MIALLIAAAAIASGSTYRINGAKLLEDCQSQEMIPYTLCIGYINGVADQILIQDAVMSAPASTCIPLKVDVPTLKTIVVTRLQQDPTLSGLPASVAVYQALLANFSCPKASH